MEQQAQASSTRRTATAASSVSTSTSPVPSAAPVESVPPLTVVKLRPRHQAAPPLNTRVAVVEPPEGLTGELVAREDPPEVSVADSTYVRGLDALKTGNAEAGALQLMQFVREWPRHPKADNALFYVGVAQMAGQDYGSAAQQFERVITSYPAGDAVIDALLKLAECHVHLKQPTQARAIWQRLITDFPGTPAAVQAEAKLASATPEKTQ